MSRDKGYKKRRLRSIANWLFGIALTISISIFGRITALFLGLYNETIIFKSINRAEYESIVEAVILPIWRDWKLDQMQNIGLLLFGSFLSVLFLIMLLFAIQHYHHKAVRYTSYAAFLAGIGMVVESFFLLLGKQYQETAIESYEGQNIFIAYMQYSIQVYACIGAAVILVSLCAYGISRKKK